MKINFYYILIFLLWPFCACAQQVSQPATEIKKQASAGNFTLEKFIPGKFSSLYVDILDNIYVLTETSQLKKYNANGDSVAAYNDVKKYGNPSLVDVSNPLKILVYYQNFSTAVTLDRLLTFRNSLNFRSLNIFSVKAICVSYDNQFWIFDEQDFTLKKINEDGKTLVQTNDLRRFLPYSILPMYITDQDNYVYLYDSTKGFAVFDYYGSLKNNIPLLNWQNINVSKGQISGFAENQLMVYNLTDKTTRIFSLPGLLQDAVKIKAGNNRLYALKSTGVEVYKIN